MIGWDSAFDPEVTYRDNAERRANIRLEDFCFDPKNEEYVKGIFRRHTNYMDWDGKVIPKVYITLETPWQGEGENKIRTRAIGYRVATEFQTVVSNFLMKMPEATSFP